jgi:isopropylmalate/homocitrate/citramalate synthase
MSFPETVLLVEVGPRDGLQNEPKTIPTEIKLNLIAQLADAGLTTIEATSFVSPKWVPQMADHRELMQALNLDSGINYPVLVPNLQGYHAAKKSGAKIIAVFTAASNTFSQKNTNCTIDEGLTRIQKIMALAKEDGIKVRGYVSCVLGCPYEGETDPAVVAPIAERLHQMGCYQVSLGDTIGVGTPKKTQRLIQAVIESMPLADLAMHFHDTYGQALANIYASLSLGVSCFDASVGGLGGCPYAPGASGNVATEDILYMLNGMNIKTGINLKKLMAAGKYINHYIGRRTRSRVSLALSHHSD